MGSCPGRMRRLILEEGSQKEKTLQPWLETHAGLTCYTACSSAVYSLNIAKTQCSEHDPTLWEYKVNTERMAPLKNPLSEWVGIHRNGLTSNDTLR